MTGATPEGGVLLKDGSRLKADLVLGADGYNSRVRATLDLGGRIRSIPDGCARHLIERRSDVLAGRAQEHWDGARRMGILP